MRPTPACSAACADQLLELGEVLREQRLASSERSTGPGAASAMPSCDRAASAPRGRCPARRAPAGGLVEGLAQVVVEARPVEVEELVVGRRCPRRASPSWCAARPGRSRGPRSRARRARRRRRCASAIETRIPLLRSRFVNSRIFFCTSGPSASAARPSWRRRGRRAGAPRRGRPSAPPRRPSARAARPSSACAFAMSPSYLRITLSVSGSPAPRRARSAFSASSARAQSSVSLIDGVFFRSSLRSRCIMPTRSSASRWPTPGTLVSRMRALELLRRGSRCRGAGSGASARRSSRARCSR